jgi:hypothetical protein
MSKYQFKYASGMLIYAVKNNQVFLLLGEDQYQSYSDFGGRCELSDRNEAVTAARECYEETSGIVNSYANLKKICEESVTVRSETFYKKPYYMFLSQIQYDEKIPIQFERAQFLISNVSNMMQFKEKLRLKWIPWSDVRRNKILLRNMFKATLLKNMTIIEETLKYALFHRNT